MTKRMGYKAALMWMVLNDDTEWTKNEESIISVTACLVADIFGKTNEQVIVDLQRALKREGLQ